MGIGDRAPTTDASRPATPRVVDATRDDQVKIGEDVLSDS